MFKARFVMTALLGFALASSGLFGQENKSENKKSGTTLKVQVTFTEIDGDKKVANLPYTFFVTTAETGANLSTVPNPWAKLRIGSRVPVYVGKGDGMQYVDVGTNIDSRAIAVENGRFDISLALERSWVEGNVLVPFDRSSSASADATSGPFKEPIIRQFRTDLVVSLHDGQTTQTTQAPDPLSGRLLTITVTMNVVK